MTRKPDKLPGQGFLGWLGRQVGYVSKAVKQPVAPPADPATTADSRDGGQAIYREQRVLEQPMPGRPGVVLRRSRDARRMPGFRPAFTSMSACVLRIQGNNLYSKARY